MKEIKIAILPHFSGEKYDGNLGKFAEGWTNFRGCYLLDIFSISSREMCVNFFGKKWGKMEMLISFIPTFLHKNVSRFGCLSEKYSENTLPKIGDFLGDFGVDIIIYIVYIIFFRRYMHSTQKCV